MPRIEIVPQGFDPESGNGTPCEDVCRGCVANIAEGDPSEDHFPSHGLGTIGSTDVLHPPYEECGYNCRLCGDLLTAEDD